VALGYIKRVQRTLIFHQMLDLPRAPNGKQPPFLCLLRLGAAAPQGVINAVDFDNPRKWQRLIIRRCLAKARQQLAPSILAGAVLPYAV
jgi:hypothetical protein